MKAKRVPLSEQLRQAVLASGVSQYRLAKDTGIDSASLCRFMAGKVGLTQANLDALAALLGCDLVARGPVKVSAPAKRGPKPKKGR